MPDYILKLKALLHDPVHKIWSFQNVKGEDIKHREVLHLNKKWHEKVALDLFKSILEDTLDDERVFLADQISSALSRIVVAPNIQKEEERKFFDEESGISIEKAKYIDSFKKIIEDVGNPSSHDEVKTVFEKIGELNFSSQEERAKFAFLFLWRFLPDIFPWIEKHPADSRAPNHSIYDHLVQTSAIATCLENYDNPALLLFTITPVQSFIATARKTSDLWAGSYLLSYLIYKAIEVIMNEVGPDAVIFPNLRGQPLVDLWLEEKHFRDKNPEIDAFKIWKEKLKSDGFKEQISIANFPNRFLAIVPYNKDSKEKNIANNIANNCIQSVENAIDELLKNIDNQEIIKEKEKIKNHILSYLKPYYVIIPFYKKSYTDTEVDLITNEYKNLVGENDLLNTIDIIKTHPYYKDYKNSNVGLAYSLLVELTEKFLASRKMVKDFINISPQSGEKCHLCGEYDILDLDWSKFVPKYVNKSERLCGICLFKRILPDSLNNKFGIEVKFPSTSEIATVNYKINLGNGKINSLKEKYNEIFKNELPQSISVPALKEHPLYSIDGQWLMESSYRKDYIKNEFGIEIEENKLQEMRNFLRQNEINPPNYYAILAMDGDNIGKWLNGSFMPKVKELIHEKVVKILEDYSKKNEDLEKLLNSKHPMSPSFHNQFSRRLSEFALNEVRKIIENDYYGKLIYAGGDDVLAFLPVEKAIDCALELNKIFKDILGQKASMSAGIVFVHHKYPLSLALNEVREAEKIAKSKYDKNSFCIKYISGSGQSRVTGMKWEEKDFLDKVIENYKREELSSKFAYDFMEIVKELISNESQKIDENIHTILKNELTRLYRHKLQKEKYDKEFEDKLLIQLDKYRNNYEAFADMLIIARFISTF